MTNATRAICLALCLLLASSANCAADDEVAKLPPRKMAHVAASGGDRARWEASWEDPEISVGYSALDGNAAGEGWTRLELFLDDAETGRAYRAIYDRKRNTAKCSIVKDFQDPENAERVEAGEGFLEVSDEMDDEEETPMFAHSYEVQSLSVGYRPGKKGLISFCLVDLEEERAYYVDYDSKRRSVSGEVFLDLSGGE